MKQISNMVIFGFQTRQAKQFPFENCQKAHFKYIDKKYCSDTIAISPPGRKGDGSVLSSFVLIKLFWEVKSQLNKAKCLR